MALASAGNLSITQSVTTLLAEGVENLETETVERLQDMTSMFKAAQLIGRAIRKVRHIEGDAFEQASVSFNLSFLFGGQIKGGPMRLFMIYSAGNFIELSLIHI